MSGYEIAARLTGQVERPGQDVHPMIAWGFELCGLKGAQDDTTAWCGAFQALTTFLAGGKLPDKPARARSWLTVGTPVSIEDAARGDTVILKRGDGPQPGPEVLDAQGHVGRLVAYLPTAHEIEVLGGNQANRVTVQRFPADRILGIRKA